MLRALRYKPFVTLGVLFMQSQSFFGADSAIHAQLMRHFDRREVDVHVACTTEPPANPAMSALRRIQAIPDVHLRPTNFGPSIHGIGRNERLRRALTTPAVGGSLVSLAAYVRRHRVDVIHATEKPRDALYGVLLGKLSGARSVVHMHVAYGDWQSSSVKWAMRHADALVAISTYVKESLLDAGYGDKRIFIVHNSLDLAEWDPNLDGDATRRSLGIAPDAPVVGIISRLFRWKGHAYLVDALAAVRAELPNVRLVIVGEDDPRANPGGGSFRAELEAQVERLGLRENVVFTGFRTDIPALMASFDVFAHPSWEEPFGMVYLEAMAMKKPVVAWASGGAPEVVIHGETGLLAPRESVDALGSDLVTLLRNPELRRRYGEAGRRRAEQSFTPQLMCATMLDVYRAAGRRTLRAS